MIKRAIVIVLAVLAATILGASFLSRKAPSYLKNSIEKALQKKVRIRDIQYTLPTHFELSGVEILEDEPFRGEPSFEAEEIKLKLSPLSLSRRTLVIDSLEMQGATVVIRKLNGKLTHPFSSVAAPPPVSSAETGRLPSERQKRAVGLEIRKLKIIDSYFKLIDYDLESGGFVVAADHIRSDIDHISLPPSSTPTRYRLEGRLLQGREEKPAGLTINGWTEFGSWDTDVSLAAKGVKLPYFQPYYKLVTQAVIQEGAVDLRALFRIEGKEFVGNIDFEIVGLLFKTYEQGELLFGLKAEEILSFLKDSSGRLRFPVNFHWNMADRSVRPREVIRKSIEKSLKQTVIGNVGRIVQGAARKLGEEEPEKEKDRVEEAVKKIKDFLKY